MEEFAFKHSRSETLQILAVQIAESAQCTWRGTNHHSRHTAPNEQAYQGREDEYSPQMHMY